MGLTIVIGDRNAGKTGILYSRVREAAAAGLSAAVLVPSGPERDRAARELGAWRPTGAVVETLDSFLDGLWETLGDGRRIVTRVERPAFIERVIQSLESPLGSVMPLSSARRMLPMVVERAAERGSESRLTRPDDPIARALVEAVDAYEAELLSHNLIEVEAARLGASQSIAREALPDVVCINRFETFTPAQLAFIESAARAGSEVMVALTYVEGSSVTRAVEPLVRRLSQSAGAKIVEARSPASPSSAEIEALQSALARETADACASGDVVLIEADGSRGEVAAAAHAVAELVDTGIALTDVAIVSRWTSDGIRRLVEALDAAGLPWRYEGTWGFRDSGFGRAALSLLRLAEEGTREHLAGFLQSGYAGISHDEADAFMRTVRSQRPATGEEVWRASEAAPGCAGRLIRQSLKLRQTQSPDAASEAIRCIADDMLTNRHGESPILDKKGSLDARARQALVETARALAQATKDLDLGALARAVEDVWLTWEDDTEGVVVSTPERVRSRRFGGVVMVGASGDRLPRSDAGPALPRRTIHALEQLGIDVRPRAGLDEERLLFYQTMTAARQKLAIVWQSTDDDGNAKDRSLFVDELLDAYGHGRAPSVERFRTRWGAPQAWQRDAVPTHAAGASVGAVAVSRGRGGLLDDDLVQELSTRDTFSASELEAYLHCPRGWFYERRLRPDGIDFEIDALQRGRLAHEALRRFYEAWHARGHERITPALLREALRLHDEVVEALVAEQPEPESIEERAEVERAIAGARRVLERDAKSFEGFAPIAHEVSFGTGESEPIDIGGWKLRGRIDRIDAGDAGLIVIDYKTGTVDMRADRFEEDRVLQAPLYSFVAARLYGRDVVGMLYRTMAKSQDRGAYLSDVVRSPWLVRTDARSQEELQALIERAIERASEAVEGIRAGDIRAEPYASKACERCMARWWCEGSRP